MSVPDLRPFTSPVNGNDGKVDANAIRANDNNVGSAVRIIRDWQQDGRKFGLYLDGIHDDTSMLTAAINTGEGVSIPKGYTALITGPITPTVEGWTLTGRGRIKLADNSNTEMLYATDVQYGWMNGVEFDGNGANQSTAHTAVHIRNGAYTRMDGIRVHESSGGGVLLENYNASALADEINIANSFIFSNNLFGVELNYAGASVQGLGDSIVGPNNHINYNGSYGVHVRGGSSNLVQGNNILTNHSHGIFIEGVPGIVFVTRQIVSANLVRNNGGSGIYVYAGGGLDRGAALQLSANQFHFNNALGGSSSNADINDTDYPSIVGNYFGDVDFTPRAVYGLSLAYATDAQIAGNTFSGNATGPFSAAFGSTYVSRANFGLADTP